MSTETIPGVIMAPKLDEMNAKQRKISEPMTADPTVTAPQTRAQMNVTNGAAVTAPTTNSTTTGMVPDLTTMSDHDLISYINPSCFDQGEPSFLLLYDPISLDIYTEQLSYFLAVQL